MRKLQAKLVIDLAAILEILVFVRLPRGSPNGSRGIRAVSADGLAMRFALSSSVRTSQFSSAMRGGMLGAVALAIALGGCASAPSEHEAPPKPFSEPIGMGLQSTGPSKIPPLAQPVSDAELAREFNNLQSNGAVYFAGWPTEAGLRALAARGVKRVIALKTADETIAARGYDPRKVAKELGITIIEMPVNAETLSDAYIDKLTREIDRDGGPTLIHCGSASTAGMVWGSYLAKSKGVSATDAMAQARAAGLKDGPLADAAQKYINATASTGAAAKSGSIADK